MLYWGHESGQFHLLVQQSQQVDGGRKQEHAQQGEEPDLAVRDFPEGKVSGGIRSTGPRHREGGQKEGANGRDELDEPHQAGVLGDVGVGSLGNPYQACR